MSRIGQLAAALLAALALGLIAVGSWLPTTSAVASGLARQDRPTIPPPRPTVAPEPEPTEQPPPTQEPEAGEEEEEEAQEPVEAQPTPTSDEAATEEPTATPTEAVVTPERAEVVEAEPEALPTTLPTTGGAEAAVSLLAALGLAAFVVGMRLRRRG
jgi:hypothetical protein